MRAWWRRHSGSRERWQRDLDEQREQDHALKAEVDRLLDSLNPDDPVAATTRRVFDLFQAWYFAFSKRSAARVGLVNATVRRLIRVIAISMAGVALVLAVIGGLSVKSTIDDAHTTNQTKRVALTTERLAVANRRLTLQIQQQRIDSLIETCRDSNMRHDRSVAFIQKVLVGQLGPHPTAAQRKAGEVGAREFDTLINDLAPKIADCRANAKRRAPK